MSIDRREFIKLAGISTIVGVGSVAAVGKMMANAQDVVGEAMPGTQAPLEPDMLHPLTAKRWGFVIDVSKFKSDEDYQKCIDVCHRIHNVPDFGNSKDEVKWIWKDTYEHTFPNTAEDAFMNKELKERQFLLLCNHCEKPACVRVCPTKATFKRKDGIVMQDMHRCIGCRFCMAACPFGARSFNYRDPRPFIKKEDPTFPTRMIGVVEKCTFCYERLVEGKKPACVEESNGAIVFGDLDDPNSEIRQIISSNYTIRRKPELGTAPSIYYVLGGKENA